jgi:ABC-type bacteriocin/lantibiotic exporter with double-glycine peptidase domain
MKTVELTVQERGDFCFCSVLQAIFRKYGIDISQEEIAGNLTPGDKMGYRVDDDKIKAFMKKLGFEYAFFYFDETPFNEPDTLLEEMQEQNGIVGIGVISPRDKQRHGHVYFLKAFQNPRVMLIDPKNGQEIEKNYYQMLREMGHDGFFGLVKRI